MRGSKLPNPRGAREGHVEKTVLGRDGGREEEEEDDLSSFATAVARAGRIALIRSSLN